MLLSEEHRAVQDAVRAYVQDRIAPHAARWDKEQHFPKDELRGLAALGCYGVAVPDAVGRRRARLPGAGADAGRNRRRRRRHLDDRQRQQLPGVLDPDGLGERRAEGSSG